MGKIKYIRVGCSNMAYIKVMGQYQVETFFSLCPRILQNMAQIWQRFDVIFSAKKTWLTEIIQFSSNETWIQCHFFLIKVKIKIRPKSLMCSEIYVCFWGWLFQHKIFIKGVYIIQGSWSWQMENWRGNTMEQQIKFRMILIA